jgi:Domain of unknown function (DUF5666)
MMNGGFLARLLVLVTASCVAACGGDMEARIGGGGTGAPMSVGLGPVSGFGSVIANGESYDETSALAFVDERPDQATPIPVSAIRLGMQIGIEHQNLLISKATVAAEVIGPVTSVATNGLTVLGQTVRVNADPAQPTVFDGLSELSELTIGSMLEVHGQRDANQDILATRIELKPSSHRVFRVAGNVANLAGRTFVIGGLVINADAAAVVPANTALANGKRVAVWTDANYAGGPLAALVVRIGGPVIPDRAMVALDGVIADFQSVAGFTLAGVAVDASSAQFVGGTASDLATGRAVRIRGTFGSMLRAERVEFLHAQHAEVHLNGFVTDFVDATRNFKVRGAAVRVSTQTSYEGGTASNLGDGVHVKLEGALVNGVVDVSRLEFLPAAASAQSVLFGNVADPVMTAADGTRTFRVIGQPAEIRTTTATSFKKGSASELGPGRSIKVKGEPQGTQFVAEEIQFMDNANDPVTFELEGIATSVMPESVIVDGRLVDLVPATVYVRDGSPVAASQLANGSVVEVSAVRVGISLIAVQVEIKTPAPGAFTLRGIVSERVPSSTEFRVASQRVSVAGNPQIIPASRTLADIRNGTDLEVTGTVANGLLTATRVRFR